MTAAALFADHHQAYTDAGWSGVLLLPPGAKHAPPAGYTGAGGAWPTRADIDGWARRQPDGNIALRMPRDVIGIDIDLYRHADARTVLEEATGSLPPTWCSTSRVDGSGIRFYRVPCPSAVTVWASAPVPGVEIIQHHHRYAVVWPSLHPEGRPYLWVDEASGEIAERPPEIDELTELPWQAIAALTQPRDTGTPRTPVAFDMAAGDMSVTVERRLLGAVAATRGDRGSRHDAACRDVCALLRLAERGEPGVPRALDTLRDAFVAAVAPDRPRPGAAETEFDAIVTGARQLIAATVGRIPTRTERDMEWQRLRAVTLGPPADPSDIAAKTFPGGVTSPGIEIRWVNDIAEEPTPEPPVLIDGFMRQGEMLVLGAPRAIGKSWLAMNIATMLARGEGKLFGHLPVRRKARVLLCQGELDKWGSEQRWHKLTGVAQLPEVAESFDRGIRVRTTKKRTTVTIDGVTMTDEHVDAELAPGLERAIVEHGIDVVILDPWATYFAGNESSNDEVEAALDKLRGLTLAHGVSWVIFHHIGKATEFREPEDAWRGASRLADWASTRVTVMPHYSEKQRREKRMARNVARAYVDVFMLRRSDPTEDFSMHRGSDGWWRRWEPDDAETEAGDGHPPATSLRDMVNQLASDGGEWASITVAADRLGLTRRAAQRLADHGVDVDLVAWAPGDRMAKRLVLTDLGREKADRAVARPVDGMARDDMSESRASSRATGSRAQSRDTPARLDIPWSDDESGSRALPTSATDERDCKTPGQGQSRSRAHPPTYVDGRAPDGAPAYDHDHEHPLTDFDDLI